METIETLRIEVLTLEMMGGNAHDQIAKCQTIPVTQLNPKPKAPGGLNDLQVGIRTNVSSQMTNNDTWQNRRIRGVRRTTSNYNMSYPRYNLPPYIQWNMTIKLHVYSRFIWNRKCRRRFDAEVSTLYVHRHGKDYRNQNQGVAEKGIRASDRKLVDDTTGDGASIKAAASRITKRCCSGRATKYNHHLRYAIAAALFNFGNNERRTPTRAESSAFATKVRKTGRPSKSLMPIFLTFVKCGIWQPRQSASTTDTHASRRHDSASDAIIML
jgi:hypothetical protein